MHFARSSCFVKIRLARNVGATDSCRRLGEKKGRSRFPIVGFHRLKITPELIHSSIVVAVIPLTVLVTVRSHSEAYHLPQSVKRIESQPLLMSNLMSKHRNTQTWAGYWALKLLTLDRSCIMHTSSGHDTAAA